MGKNSKVDWCHHTFNPWWGCTKVSAGCANCFAEAWAKRTGHKVWGPTAPRRFLSEHHWSQPPNWNLQAALAGERHRVLCGSMCDVFEIHSTPEIYIRMYDERERLFALIEDTPSLDWVLTTKRPENFARFLPNKWLNQPRENVWLIASVEDQPNADKRIPYLLQTPAVIHGLSCEPLLSLIDLGDRMYHCPTCDELRGYGRGHPSICGRDDCTMQRINHGIDWVIAGCESGGKRKRRPAPTKWFRDLCDQCDDADTPFFLKQMDVDGELVKMPTLDGDGWDFMPNPAK